MRQTNFRKHPASSDEINLYRYVTDKAEKVVQELTENISKSPLDEGKLVFIYGPVNSGKSIIACRLLESLTASKMRGVTCAQPNIARSDLISGEIYSRGGVSCNAVGFQTKAEIEDLFHAHSVVIIDELQFIPYDIQSFFLKEAEQFVERGGWLIAMGLRYTSVRTEFLLSAIVYDRADLVYELTSTCQMCGRKGARWNQRLIGGRAADYQGPDLVPPSEDVSYEPRCNDCHIQGV